MTSFIRAASKINLIGRPSVSITRVKIPRRLFSDSPEKGSSSASRGEPAAAVPNSPSPFQLTPESLKQQREVEEAARVPENARMPFLRRDVESVTECF